MYKMDSKRDCNLQLEIKRIGNEGSKKMSICCEYRGAYVSIPSMSLELPLREFF